MAYPSDRKSRVEPMSVVRTLLHVLAFSLSLFAALLAFQAGALAQAQNAYQDQIAAFAPKLEEARTTQADLNRVVMCMDQHDSDLVQRRGELELRLGQLITEESKLLP